MHLLIFCILNMFASLLAHALGLFQMGSGTLLPVWTAVFTSRSETKEMWGDCADALMDAGLAEVFSNTVHFRDRHVGAKLFEVGSYMLLLPSTAFPSPNPTLTLGQSHPVGWGRRRWSVPAGSASHSDPTRSGAASLTRGAHSQPSLKECDRKGEWRSLLHVLIFSFRLSMLVTLAGTS